MPHEAQRNLTSCAAEPACSMVMIVFMEDNPVKYRFSYPWPTSVECLDYTWVMRSSEIFFPWTRGEERPMVDQGGSIWDQGLVRRCSWNQLRGFFREPGWVRWSATVWGSGFARRRQDWKFVGTQRKSSGEEPSLKIMPIAGRYRVSPQHLKCGWISGDSPTWSTMRRFPPTPNRFPLFLNGDRHTYLGATRSTCALRLHPGILGWHPEAGRATHDHTVLATTRQVKHMGLYAVSMSMGRRGVAHCPLVRRSKKDLGRSCKATHSWASAVLRTTQSNCPQVHRKSPDPWAYTSSMIDVLHPP